jgi:hypothetical protein
VEFHRAGFLCVRRPEVAALRAVRLWIILTRKGLLRPVSRENADRREPQEVLSIREICPSKKLHAEVFWGDTGS